MYYAQLPSLLGPLLQRAMLSQELQEYLACHPSLHYHQSRGVVSLQLKISLRLRRLMRSRRLLMRHILMEALVQRPPFVVLRLQQLLIVV
jgi:hypothetical protein